MPPVQDVRVHAPLVIAEGAVLIFVCSVMVILRFYARRVSASSFGLDDFAIAAALLFVIGMAVTIIAEAGLKGLGYPSSVVGAGPGQPDANVAGWPGELIQVPALGCIKLSFLFLYRRLFPKTAARNFNWANWIMIFIITAWMIGYFFTLLFICGIDFKAYWTSSTTEQTQCLPTKPVHFGYAVSDVVTDVLTVLLPIPEIWKRHMPTRRKFAITGVFGLGAVTVVMSIMRMVIYYRALTVQFDPDADFEYITTLASYFSLLEAGLGLCAACLPVQYGLFRSGKVRSIFRSGVNPTTAGSQEFGSSQSSPRSDAGYHFARDTRPGNKKHSQLLGSDVSLPIHAAEHRTRNSEVEKETPQREFNILVETRFGTSEHEV